MSELSTNSLVNTQPSFINDRMSVCVDVNADISEQETAALMIYDNGMILSCNQTAGELFGYPVRELVGQHINKLLPNLAGAKLVLDKRANLYLRFLSRIGHHFEAVRMNGICFTCALFFIDVIHLGQHQTRVIIRPDK